MIRKEGNLVTYERDVATISKWSDLQVERAEKEAVFYLEMEKECWNDDVTASVKHARRVRFLCDKELKKRGLRKESDWEKLFK